MKKKPKRKVTKLANSCNHPMKCYSLNPSASALNEELPPSASSTQDQRQRKRPSWMIDYVSGDELSDDDTTTHFSLFADCNPMAFEDSKT